MKINVVTVLGANGTMGSNISGIFASFGNAKVYMVCRTLEKAKMAVEKAANSVKCDSIRNNLLAVDYSELERCIGESDLIFESVSENIDTKKEIFKIVANSMREDAVCCSGTSGLSINNLAVAFPENLKKRFCGMHMFNPPYNLILCEMIPTAFISKELFSDIKDYAENVLKRKVIETTDTPGFLGNRIGFQFINSAIQMAVKYKENGGIDYIDYLLGGVTGRSMPPILTADFVGLDIHKSIVDYLYEKTNDYAKQTFVLPEFVNGLIDQGKLGRKTNEGFYRTRIISEQKTKEVFDIVTEKYRPMKKYNVPFISQMKNNIIQSNYIKAYDILLNNESAEAEICKELLINYVLYALITNESVGKTLHAADDAMVCGFNWCPPLGIIEVMGGADRFLELIKDKNKISNLSGYSLEKLENLIDKSCYDYRRFIKA